MATILKSVLSPILKYYVLVPTADIEIATAFLSKIKKTLDFVFHSSWVSFIVGQ